MHNHQPRITQRHDGSWVVECTECRRDRHADPPIGIGLPLRDRETAELLRDNHAGRRLPRLAAS